MVDVKLKETVYSFLIPKKQDLTDFMHKFLNSYYIEDFTVYYSPILKEIFPEKFSVDEIDSPEKDQVEVLIDILNNYYLEKKNYDKVSSIIEKKLKASYPNYPEYFLYLKSILITISFRVQPLYSFSQKERDMILKKQDSSYGVSAEIDAEKDENNSDISTDMYSGWIDLRGIDIFNNFRKNQTEEKISKNALVLDIYTNSDFLALFDFIFNKFTTESIFPILETYPLM